MGPTLTEGQRQGEEPFSRSASAWLTRRQVFGLLIGYFVLQALFRTLISDSAELDESEQLLMTQDWRWGYGSDPPLYTWLQIVFFQVFGTNILALALLKNGLLLCAFVFTYLAAYEATRDDRVASLSALSLLLFPQITWESQRDLTHSVLATALAAATLYAALRTWRAGGPSWYVALGACLGLGTLSKSSYCLFALALALAALSIPELRRAILRKQACLSLAVFLIITVPYFRWFYLNPALALNRSEEVIRSSAGPWLSTRVLGLFSVLKCAILLNGALTAVYLVAFRGQPSVAAPSRPSIVQQWVGRTLLVIALLSALIVLLSGIQLRDRWFQPIVFLLAISAALFVAGRLTLLTEKRLGTIVGGLAVIALLVLPGIPLAAAVTHRPTRLNSPYSALTASLKRVTGKPVVIVAANRLVAGNLRLNYPGTLVVAPEFRRSTLPADLPWLVVWDATKSPAASPGLVVLMQGLRATNIAGLTPSYVSAPFKYTRAKTMTLGYLWFP